jgi:hypothetical protein
VPIETDERDLVLVPGVRWTPTNTIQPAGDHLALLGRTGAGRTISTCGFTTRHAADIKCDQRRNT